MSRGPRPHRAIIDAVPIAKERGIARFVMSGRERVFDIAIVSVGLNHRSRKCFNGINEA